MSVSVELSASTFSRLQGIAVPLVDSIDSVIVKLLDHWETNDPRSSGYEPNSVQSNSRRFSPVAPPHLKWTKVLRVSIDGVALAKPNWNRLLDDMVRLAKTRAESLDDLKRMIIIPYLVGRKEDEGYRYLADCSLSVQGQDSNSSWKAAFHIARRLGVHVEVEFVWRQKDDAAFPGQSGILDSSTSTFEMQGSPEGDQIHILNPVTS